MSLLSCFRSGDKDDLKNGNKGKGSESESESDNQPPATSTSTTSNRGAARSVEDESNKAEHKITLAKKAFDDRLKELDNLFKNHHELLDAKVAAVEGPKGKGVVTGPEDEEEVKSEGKHAAAGSISSYPRKPKNKRTEDDSDDEEKLGDPICDRYGFEIFEQGVAVVSLADGCNWGPKPFEAARIATKVFQEFMRKKLPKIDTVRTAGQYLIQAFAEAHTSILKAPLERGLTDIWETGTTTLIGGLLLKLDAAAAQQHGQPYLFICASIGDCKAFHAKARSDKVEDITWGNRPAASITNVNDPGGRLGPYVGKEGSADLRNLGLFCTLCQENDLIMCLSDGVYDNFDPQQLNVSTKDVDLSAEAWEDADVEDAEKAKDAYRTRVLAEMLRKSSQEETDESASESEDDAGAASKKKKKKDKAGPSGGLPGVGDANLAQFVKIMLEHTKKVTEYSRQWMEEHPTARMPDARSKKKDPSFQGKMDHSTILIVKVGSLD